MNENEIKILIEKAKKFIETANLLLNHDDYDSTASRVYYAMFYAGEAILLTKNLKSKTHDGFISLFGEHFIKNNIFPLEMMKQLRMAFDKRQIGDYGTAISITKKEAEDLVKIGQKFINNIITFLKNQKIL